MSSYQIWSVLLPLVVTLILAKSSAVKAIPIEQESESSPPLEPQQKRIDCKLTFDAMTMDSLVQPNSECTGLPVQDEETKEQQVADEEVKIGREGKGMATANKLEEEQQPEQEEEQLPEPAPEPVQRHLMSSMDSQPIYELQLVVWPSDDIEDGDDFNPLTLATTTTSTTTTTTTRTPSTTTAPTLDIFPLYEDQLVVFPQMDFEEENLDYIFDELPPPATVSPPPSPTPTPTSRPWPTASSIYVVQDYHVIHPNGTEEYKLVLSNGVVDYKKIYKKAGPDGQLINVQEGYYTVPIAGRKNQFQTHFYIADERGYNVYKIEHSHQQPDRPKLLHYKATKLP